MVAKPAPLKFAASVPDSLRDDAISALRNLGFQKATAIAAIDKALAGGARSLEQVTRQALALASPATRRMNGDAAPLQAAPEDGSMKFSKYCSKCKKGIRGPYDKCRTCRVADGEVDTNASRKAKAGPRHSKLMAERKRAKAARARPVAPPQHTNGHNGNGHANGGGLVLHVTEEMLDNWWSKLPPERKLGYVEQDLLAFAQQG